jgi:hypothetical protein
MSRKCQARTLAKSTTCYWASEICHMIDIRRIFDLGKTHGRVGTVVFDIRIDTGRHSPWRIAAPCFAKTSSQRRIPGRGAAWRRPDRDNSRACARLAYRLRKELIRHAEHQVTQITADIILLDNLLAEYGPEARPIREQMRNIIGPLADRLWREKQASAVAPFELSGAAEKAYLGIQSLSPQNDLQRSLQTRAAQLSTDLVQTRLILFAGSDNVIPTPFLAILVLWLVIIFASFSLFSPLNVTVFTCLSLFRAVGVVRDFLDFGT